MLDLLGLNNEYLLERKIKYLEDNNKHLLEKIILLKKEIKVLKQTLKEKEKENSYVII